MAPAGAAAVSPRSSRRSAPQAAARRHAPGPACLLLAAVVAVSALTAGARADAPASAPDQPDQPPPPPPAPQLRQLQLPEQPAPAPVAAAEQQDLPPAPAPLAPPHRPELETPPAPAPQPLQPERATHQPDWQQLQVLDELAGVWAWPGFLSDAECDHLVERARPRLARSGVVATEANGSGVAVSNHSIRTSSGAFFARGEDPVLAGIEERIARWTLLPVVNQEGAQVLSYGRDEQYRPHWDAFQDNTTVRNGGNRHTTVLVYLHEPDEGGETVFPLLPARQQDEPSRDSLSECARKGLAVRPRKGMALMWHNLSPSGAMTPHSLHAGCPVVRGTKWALVKWIRTSRYTTEAEILALVKQRAANQQLLAQRVAAALALASLR